MKHFPKIKFTNFPIEQEIKMLHRFLFKDHWGRSRYIYKNHPRLEPFKKLPTIQKKEEFLTYYVKRYWQDNKINIEKNKQVYKKEWQKKEKVFLKQLAAIMQTAWPKDKKYITAMMSINTICPRFLDHWSFTIFYCYRDINRAMETIMHETCHFLYFKKWREVFPDAERKTFESPHIEWHLSELIAPIILQDQRIAKILGKKANFYQEHSQLKIGKKTAPTYFKNIYQKYAVKQKDFAKFLKMSYAAIKKHQNVFLNIGK